MLQDSAQLKEASGQGAFKTERTDLWWLSPTLTFLYLLAFVAYATWRAFENDYYRFQNYLSPFYSPTIVVKWKIFGFHISPALWILPFPLLFRFTCYYYRKAYYRAFLGDGMGGKEVPYEVPTFPGMVVLDAIHYIQAHLDSSLACRWNCKAAKCGSCSAEIDGYPRLMCKTRIDHYPKGPIRVRPMRTFPVIKDLVCDVSWNYEVAGRIPLLAPRPDAPMPFLFTQMDIDRIQEFHKCIECFLCQNVCHVLRNHNRKDAFFGPRFFIKVAGLDMHPMDALNRAVQAKQEAGIELCNITKCCTEVCPEGIRITDNGIIPMKERVIDTFYDPLRNLLVWMGVLGKKGRRE